MEALFSAAVGELVSRCLSFLISRYLYTLELSKVEILRKLERALLRIAITVEEAGGRLITNKAMLQQLKMLRQEMHKGYYVLDKFRYLDQEEGKVSGRRSCSSLALPSTSNPGKRFPSSATRRHGRKELEVTLDSVQNMVTDMYEFVAFLKNSPPMFCQPYSMYLLFERCMFGRQAEMERTIYFLLQREPPGDFTLGVLPIIGRGKVGKTTLVEHVCDDERVRHHFSQIVFFSGNKFVEEKLATLMDGGIIKHKSKTQNAGRMLVIVELDEDVEEGAWRRLLSASRSCLPSGSKIIVTSRSEKIMNFGTTQALRLNFLTREACWYFFKVLVFGSTYAEDQPKLASIAMAIFEEYYCHNDLLGDFTGSFANSKNIAALLRANASMQHWRRILACVRRNGHQNLLPCSADTNDVRVENGHYYISRISNISQYVQVDRHHRVVRLDDEEAPKITIDEVMYGRLTPKGKFEAVWWRSHLQPHYRYITTCEIHDSKCMDGREKSSRKRKSLS
ncbi:hypothetical protein PVAP13_3KG415300 [Panicum virgatum]|uniref:NB-ARC domain-containing protein n=1 Tax=Panicum virgatum TaxID=38727 RepID=A0A8T0V325_PANVG|nr:hypothetical protein PVAP13_3KG415300 [Panicum virgatum]